MLRCGGGFEGTAPSVISPGEVPSQSPRSELSAISRRR
jgi:hypothetical protein